MWPVMMCNLASVQQMQHCNSQRLRLNHRQQRQRADFLHIIENRNVLFCNRYQSVSFHAIVGIIGYVWSRLKCRNSVTDCNNSNWCLMLCGETPGPASGQGETLPTYCLGSYVGRKLTQTSLCCDQPHTLPHTGTILPSAAQWSCPPSCRWPGQRNC